MTTEQHPEPLDVARRLKQLSKTLEALADSTRLIHRLDSNRTRRSAEIRKAIGDVKRGRTRAVDLGSVLKDLDEWLSGYEARLEAVVTEIRQQFGRLLEQELAGRGRTLSGHYPTLRSGLFQLELHADSGSATIWYGPKQEKLGTCDLEPEAIASELDALEQQLGSDVEAPTFVERLEVAYSRASALPSQGDITITSLLPEMVLLGQSARFRANPLKKYYKEYDRASFSFDLYTHRRAVSEAFTLNVATRAQARSRTEYLWIPDRDDGTGSTYSSLTPKKTL